MCNIDVSLLERTPFKLRIPSKFLIFFFVCEFSIILYNLYFYVVNISIIINRAFNFIALLLFSFFCLIFFCV